MASNQSFSMKGNTSSRELSLKCSKALDFGARLYKDVVEIRDCASLIPGRSVASLNMAVMEQGSVLLHLASEVTDGNDLEKVRAELSRREIEDLL